MTSRYLRLGKCAAFKMGCLEKNLLFVVEALSFLGTVSWASIEANRNTSTWEWVFKFDMLQQSSNQQIRRCVMRKAPAMTAPVLRIFRERTWGSPRRKWTPTNIHSDDAKCGRQIRSLRPTDIDFHVVELIRQLQGRPPEQLRKILQRKTIKIVHFDNARYCGESMPCPNLFDHTQDQFSECCPWEWVLQKEWGPALKTLCIN